jgi:hypothetical protein
MFTPIAALILLCGSPWSNSPRWFQSTRSQPSASNGTQTSPASQTTAEPKSCPAPRDSSSSKAAPCTAPRVKHKKHHSSAATNSSSGSTVVVHNGSTSDPAVAISPTLTQQQASQELSTTNQLLANADANLKQVAQRQLSSDEEDTVKQIEVYMEEARTAVKTGETQRAYNLANKANLLSSDLARPRH